MSSLLSKYSVAASLALIASLAAASLVACGGSSSHSSLPPGYVSSSGLSSGHNKVRRPQYEVDLGPDDPCASDPGLCTLPPDWIVPPNFTIYTDDPAADCYNDPGVCASPTLDQEAVKDSGTKFDRQQERACARGGNRFVSVSANAPGNAGGLQPGDTVCSSGPPQFLNSPGGCPVLVTYSDSAVVYYRYDGPNLPLRDASNDANGNPRGLRINGDCTPSFVAAGA